MSDIEEDDESKDLYKPSFVLVAIDTDPSMFVKNETTHSIPFKECLKACYNLANSLLFVQNKRSWNPFGVVLAKDDPAEATFVNFKDNILNSIKFLKKKQGLPIEELEDSYQRKKNLDLGAFFLFCKKKFKEIDSVFYKKILIYVTNDDNPHRGDPGFRFAALNEARNFEANDISFDIVTMKPKFDYTLFYNELFSVIKDAMWETFVEDEEGLLERLSLSIMTRITQRKMHFFPFVGDDSRFLKVIQKSFIREEKIYNNSAMSSDGKPLKKFAKTNPTIRTTFKLKKYPYPLECDQEERLQTLDTDLPVGYTLLHVSDRNTDFGITLSKPVILEVDPKEDLDYFGSFWQYCVDNDKVLVCARKLRQPDKLRFVEFIPKYVNSSRVFIVKAIPFNNEFKRAPSHIKEEDFEYPEQQINTVNQLINNLTFDFSPKMFTNPSAAKKKAYLRSKLLEEEKEDVEDVTLDKEGIDRSLGTSGETFRRFYRLEEEVGPKRKTSRGGGGGKRGRK